MATLYSSGASTPDATESTAGKLRISTDAERIAGTNDTTAMTPLKVAEAIAASSSAVTGALVYRGSYDASTQSPDLTTASKGDFYLVSVAGALDGVALSVGDHVVFNQDASSPVTSAMFDKIDSTDAVASVNGQTGVVSLTASDVNALASGDNISELTNDSGYLTSAPVTSVNTLTGAVNLTASDVGALATGDNVSALVNDSGYLTSAPVTSVNTQTGAVTLAASDVGALASGDNISELTNDSGYITSTLSADIIVDTDGAYDLGTESARLGLTFSDLDGAVTFKASNASGAQITKGQPVYIAGVSGDVPTVALADADAAAMPSAGLAGETANAGAEIRIITFGNLTDVDTSAFSLGDTLYIDTTAGALTATPPAGEAAKLQNIGKVIRVHATSGVIKVGGAGRSAATPNLDQNKIFLGDANNRAVSTALSAIDVGSFNDDGTYLTSAPVTSVNSLTGAVNLTAADVGALATGDNVSALVNDAGYLTSAPVTSVNTLTGAVTLSANDLAADHTANNYTPANANIDGHLSGIDTALASASGAGNPNIYVSTSTSYAPSASDAPNLLVWYGGSNTSTFTLTLPYILSILTGTGAVNSVVESFTMWVGRGYDGDITLSSTNGIDGLGGTISYASTLTVPAGTWVKIVGWKTSSNNARYLVEVPESAPVSSVNSLTGAVTLSANDLAADHTANNYTPANANIDGHLSGIDSALASAGGLAYTAITADPAPALANKHYSCTGTFTITLDTSGYNAGEQIRIKNMGTGTITIDPQTGTIDGSSTDYTLDVQFSAITLVSTGTNWEIV